MTAVLERIDSRALGPATIRDLRDDLAGEVLTAGDAGYDKARQVWNGMFDRRPALIARCANAADVASAVRFARTLDLELAVRSGGHSVAGHSSTDGGMVIDLTRMKGIAVDPRARTVRVEPGVLLGELDAATQAFGLAVPAGTVSHTGVAGLALGGGTGWLMRKHGLTIDNLLAIELVTADGRLRRADAEQHPDLFWAARGGGGNFGVVTAFEFRAHPVGPIVLAGPVLYGLDRAEEVLRVYRQFFADAPDEVTAFPVFMTVPPAAPFPERLWGTRAIALDVCYAGPIAEGERVVAPLRTAVRADLDLVGPMPYVVRQSVLDETAPHGLHFYDTSQNLPGLDDGAIDALVDVAARAPSPLSHLIVGPFGGAVGRVPVDATAFPHREAAFNYWAISVWRPEEDPEPHRSWAGDVRDAMRPFSTGGVYVNALSDIGEDRVRSAYGPNYDRLAKIKRCYDPTNLFRRNQNIAPAAG